MVDRPFPLDPSAAGMDPATGTTDPALSPGATDPAPGATDHSPIDGVQVRTLLAGPLPLLVASLGGGQRATDLREAVVAAGLQPLPGFIGTELPQGARVGFVVEGAQLRLVDERDDALLRADRRGLDAAWLDAALAKKGTMFVVVEGLELGDRDPVGTLARRLDAAAREGGVIGAIVGIVEERPKLPLLF